MKKSILYAAFLCILLLCAACSRSAAAGLDALISLDPGEVETVVVEFLSPQSPAPGKKFALNREEYPEQIEGILETLSRNAGDYSPSEDTYWIPRWSLSFLDREGCELLRVYEHDARTVSFDRLFTALYRSHAAIDAAPISQACAIARKAGLLTDAELPPELAELFARVGEGMIYGDKLPET